MVKKRHRQAVRAGICVLALVPLVFLINRVLLDVSYFWLSVILTMIGAVLLSTAVVDMMDFWKTKTKELGRIRADTRNWNIATIVFGIIMIVVLLRISFGSPKDSWLFPQFVVAILMAIAIIISSEQVDRLQKVYWFCRKIETGKNDGCVIYYDRHDKGNQTSMRATLMFGDRDFVKCRRFLIVDTSCIGNETFLEIIQEQGWQERQNPWNYLCGSAAETEPRGILL